MCVLRPFQVRATTTVLLHPFSCTNHSPTLTFQLSLVIHGFPIAFAACP